MSRTGDWIIELEEINGPKEPEVEPPCVPGGPSEFGYDGCWECDQCPYGGEYKKEEKK